MPIGFVRRLARLSLTSAFTPTLDANWTTQETTTYNSASPAATPVVWGGTVANLDRDFTKTGSTRLALGALLTFVHKPETNALGQHGSLAGAIVKVAVTYAAGSTAALELWSKAGSTWTKRRRVPVAQLARSGDVVVFDLTGPVLDTDDVDAYWITLAPDIGTETLTWTILHLFGVCPNDPVTPDCPPGTAPEDCAAPECGVDVEDWVCLDPPDETDPAPAADPFVLPPIPVTIAFPPATAGCPFAPYNILKMTFGEIPTGGSIVVTAVRTQGVLFSQGTSQTISAAGDLTWTVSSGFNFLPTPAQVFPVSTAFAAVLGPIFYPKVDPAGMQFTFQLRLAASAFETAGALLDILTYFWTFGYANNITC